MDKKDSEITGLTEPIKKLVQRGMAVNMSSEQMAREIARAIAGASYPHGEINLLTSPARMLVTLILEPTMTQRALSISLGISEAAVQKTIRQLTQKKLVTKRKIKNRNIYSVDAQVFMEIPDIAMLIRVIESFQSDAF